MCVCVCVCVCGVVVWWCGGVGVSPHHVGVCAQLFSTPAGRAEIVIFVLLWLHSLGIADHEAQRRMLGGAMGR